MKFIQQFFLFAIILGINNFLVAQETPPIENFGTEDYGAENQNWSISQSSNNYIYVANNSGLLEFNGANWKLYNSPNNTVVRSVAVIEDKIYTGSYMEFGYWVKNNLGELEYTSLSQRIKSKLIEEEFWNIVHYENFTLFQSLNRIYIYNSKENSFKIIKSKSNLPKIFRVNNSLYFQVINKGLFEIEKGNPVLISDNALFKKSILVSIFSNEDKKIFFQTQNDGFFHLINNETVKWNASINSEIERYSVYSSMQLADGSFVIGTISNGVYFVNKFGEKTLHINQENGLENNTVLALFEDKNKNVWLGLDNGVSLVNFDSEYRVYNDIHGKLGSVYASVVANGNLYLGTNQGLFYKKFNTNNEFNFVKGTNGQVWCLKVLDNNLFCGHNVGTFLVEDGNVKLISAVMGAWDIKEIEGNPNLLLQGNYDGLHVLEKKNGNWYYRNKIKGFDISSRYFEFVSGNNVLVSHEYKGIFNISIDEDYRKIIEFNRDYSVPKGLKSSLARYNNDVLYTSNEGVFKFNSKFRNFSKDEMLSKNLFKNEKFISGKLILDKNSNTLWGFTTNNLIYFSQGKLDNEPKASKISLHASIRRSIPGFESISHLWNKEFLLGNSNGYLILDLNKIKSKSFEISINSIEKSVLNDQKTSVPFEDNSFDFEENNLFFSFSVPIFDKYAAISYQYQLVGIYNEWSNWSSESEVSFKNLPHGDYKLLVRAKIGNTISNNIANYSFKIQRPWYISKEMILVYFVLIIVLFYLIHLFYKRYYTRQKQSLLRKKQREFTLSQLENEKLIMNLTNEKLKNEIDSKTRELSSSTMNIIKNNELLSQIKEELLAVKDQSGIKSVLKIINTNLNQNNDWELFEEAFNNADTDFLKKVKQAHPVLTPNDLRLCAYLRLNLSSKEIAPLLNISARSVEIKRYRLRKKLELDHDKSLVEYILEL